MLLLLQLVVLLLSVHVVDPVVGGLPYDGAYPHAEVGGHEVHEAEARQ